MHPFRHRGGWTFSDASPFILCSMAYGVYGVLGLTFAFLEKPGPGGKSLVKVRRPASERIP